VTPTRLGTYPAECTELCGPGHSLMRATVRVVTPAAFTAWLAALNPNAPPPVGVPPAKAAQPGVPGAPSTSAAPSSSSSSSPAASAAAGKTLFSSTCGACHTLAGTTGTIGPNLTQRLASDCATPASMKIRGKTLTDCIHTAITDPYAYIPSGFHSGIMPPNFASSLGATKVQDLVNFLSSVTK
jgi:cytochrome c5